MSWVLFKLLLIVQGQRNALRVFVEGQSLSLGCIMFYINILSGTNLLFCTKSDNGVSTEVERGHGLERLH